MTVIQLTKKDFESDQEVRWCPGCGDYAVLATLQRLLPKLSVPKEKHVFVSGIGCSSRFPYYMNTYGFHTIHGRAPAVATGVKVANPDLTVWVITGDGDALSIGGNHFMHLMRRNVDVNVLLFNNRIYGLTKGQYSPTSEQGKVTKSTPYGSLESPVDPVSLALASKATFVARALAVDAKGLGALLEQAHEHRGTSFIEIFQNCNVFNDGAFDDFSERKVRLQQQLELRDGEPLLFGVSQERGIVLDGLTPRVVEVGGEISVDQVLRYDQRNKSLALMVSQLVFPDFPVPMGVFYREERLSYEYAVSNQVETAIQQSGLGDLDSLLRGGETWEVSP